MSADEVSKQSCIPAGAVAATGSPDPLSQVTRHQGKFTRGSQFVLKNRDPHYSKLRTMPISCQELQLPRRSRKARRHTCICCSPCTEGMRGFPKIRGIFGAVPITRVIVYWDLFILGPPIIRNSHAERRILFPVQRPGLWDELLQSCQTCVAQISPRGIRTAKRTYDRGLIIITHIISF